MTRNPHVLRAWPHRLRQAVFPLPEGVFALVVFLVGLGVGILICTHQQEEEERRPALQQQLDAIDTRLRALEHR